MGREAGGGDRDATKTEGPLDGKTENRFPMGRMHNGESQGNERKGIRPNRRPKARPERPHARASDESRRGRRKAANDAAENLDIKEEGPKKEKRTRVRGSRPRFHGIREISEGRNMEVGGANEGNHPTVRTGRGGPGADYGAG